MRFSIDKIRTYKYECAGALRVSAARDKRGPALTRPPVSIGLYDNLTKICSSKYILVLLLFDNDDDTTNVGSMSTQSNQLFSILNFTVVIYSISY